ncbi:hypothetical protein ELE36_00265 [Pseudolysobacter antarcticus]|uniref:DUF3592 domain-containing protein n=1 Tax=Pseudolysobacter antarcticus TaxID=2511995 RepID=A0A411HEQ8_9GAMM|nr:hypothetical protein [Pseudolysobacter antarcticus]QBB68934.1 hypothetical protein ELE36_00265 [Pseudolysobacter antarcticus]
MERVFLFVFFTALLGCSAVATCASTYQLFYFFGFSADFVVVSKYAVCEQPLNNRCEAHYVTRSANGTSGELAPFGYEFESEALEPGSRVVKRDIGFSNEINGKRELWPYLWPHIIVSLLGEAGLLIWYFGGGLKVFNHWLRGFHTED